MIIYYVTFSVSIGFISWIVGMIINALIKNTAFYKTNLYDLNFIESEYINKLIGLDAIKWIVKNTFFWVFNPKLRLKLNRKITVDDLISLRSEMLTAEISHLNSFVFACGVVVVMLVKTKLILALFIMIVNVIMNLYPSLLQQQNKRRIDKLIKDLGADT